MRPRRERNSAEVIDVSTLRQLDALVALQNIACEFQMPLVSRRAVQLNERHFYFRVPGENRLLVGSRPKIGQQIAVNEPSSRVHQGAVARRAIICNRTLN